MQAPGESEKIQRYAVRFVGLANVYYFYSLSKGDRGQRCMITVVIWTGYLPMDAVIFQRPNAASVSFQISSQLVAPPLRSLSHSPHPRLNETLSPLLALFGVRLGSSSVFINRGLARLRRRWASLHGFKRHPLSSSLFGLTRRRTRTLLSSLSRLFLLSSLRKIGVASRQTWFLSGQGSCQPPSLKKKLLREKILDKQLHSLLEQLVAKQAQAEALVSKVHQKEKELEGLSGLWKTLESNSLEVNATRNRFGRSIFDKGSASSDCIVDVQHKPLFTIGRWDSLQRPALLRSGFVLYILALQILVFLKISF
ncbi:uncharacterized protein LOC130137303 [Syzygium oleosum]|uniref:uncharacterized protein LOC130137303 n=1 Tax=Syzygium oleosum TaxID=219896 RepID=UPI0024B8B6D9|nr:uncharacterized protein LOC130137303 [Syzygium oleosum]